MDNLLKEIVGVVVLNRAVLAWQDEDYFGSLLLFALYGALKTK